MKIIIGCGGVVIKDKKLLLTKRVKTKKNYPNHWTLPAGTPEPYDLSLSDTAAREVKEEVNLKFIPTEKLGFYETLTEKAIIVGFVYLGKWTGEVKALEAEVSDIGWFTYQDTKSLDIAFSYNETILDLYNKGLII